MLLFVAHEIYLVLYDWCKANKKKKEIVTLGCGKDTFYYTLKICYILIEFNSHQDKPIKQYI